MTDVLQIVDSTLAVAAQTVQTVEVGYIAQTVATGGGAVTSVNSQTGAVVLAAADVGAPPTSRLVTAGTGLTGGGSLAADRTLAVSYGGSAGTSAQGNDSRLSDARTPLAHASSHALGGSDAVSLASIGGKPPVFPLSHYGLVAATGDPNEFQRPGVASSNDRYFARMFVPAGAAFSKLWIAVTTAGTWDAVSGPNQIVLYDDTGAQLTTTTDTGTMWATNGWRGGALGANQVAQTSDRFVYVMAIIRGVTGCSIAFPLSGTDNGPWFAVGPGQTKRRGIYSAGATVPGSFDPTSFGSASAFIPLIGAQT